MGGFQYMDSPVPQAAQVTAKKLGLSLSPEVLGYLESKYPQQQGVSLSKEQEFEAEKNLLLVIYEAAAISRVRSNNPQAIELKDVTEAVRRFCDRFPDFWPFCPP